MEQVHLKIDSKGRLCIPQKIREQIGDTATLKQTMEGFLIVPGKPTNSTTYSAPKRLKKPQIDQRFSRIEQYWVS